MSITIVIPTNRSRTAIEPLIRSLAAQTLSPYEIIIVYDCQISAQEYEQYLSHIQTIFHLTSIRVRVVSSCMDSTFVVGKGASYVRNVGRKLVTTEWMMFVDDDNVFVEDALEIVMDQADLRYDKKNTIVAPVQYDNDRSEVREAVADGFTFGMCRPHRLTHTLRESADRYVDLTLSSSNCLIGPTKIFEQYPFDEQVPFVYEDLIMTAQMVKGGVHIVCDTWLDIIHDHRDRPKLAQLYIDTPERAFYKIKHRMKLIQVLDPRGIDRWLCYMVGLPGQTGRLVLHVLIYGKVREWGGLLRGMWRGLVQ